MTAILPAGGGGPDGAVFLTTDGDGVRALYL
jgi:hypothetical protein